MLRINYLFLAVLWGLSGCSSIMNKSQHPVFIQSSPSGADFEIANKKGLPVHEGRTPEWVLLDSSDGYFSGEHYDILFKSGDITLGQAALKSKVSRWYFANLLFAEVGVAAMLVLDPLTGRMFRLPDTLNVPLDVSALEGGLPDSKSRGKVSRKTVSGPVSYVPFPKSNWYILAESGGGQIGVNNDFDSGRDVDVSVVNFGGAVGYRFESNVVAQVGFEISVSPDLFGSFDSYSLGRIDPVVGYAFDFGRLSVIPQLGVSAWYFSVKEGAFLNPGEEETFGDEGQDIFGRLNVEYLFSRDIGGYISFQNSSYDFGRSKSINLGLKLKI
ncbi:MAG: hypothetical protein COB04_14945 [Gammaproteobacteria bacterium]|nr:MAG: hypothetical protein COB04_14945 [Gammaproteobacteria bacterium]